MKKSLSLLAAAGLTAVGLTTPAMAADPVYELVGPSELAVHAYPTSGEPRVTSLGLTAGSVWDQPAKPATFKVDLSRLAGVVDVAAPGGLSPLRCTTAGTTMTCHNPVARQLFLDVSAAKGSKAGASGELAVTATTEGGTIKPFTTRIKVGGPDLRIADPKLPGKAKTGDELPLAVRFENTGSIAAKGVDLSIESTLGTVLAEKYDNCAYGAGDLGGYEGVTAATCTLEGDFEPGTAYEVVEPLTLEVTGAALRESVEMSVFEAGKGPKGAAAKRGATGKKLTFKPVGKSAAKAPKAADLDRSDNTFRTRFEVGNTADLAAIGATVQAKAGQTVKVDLGYQSHGPAWFDHQMPGARGSWMEFQVPEGATLTKVPGTCFGFEADGTEHAPGKVSDTRSYRCGSVSVLPGEKELHSFELKVDKVVSGAKGAISVSGHAPDPVQGNNKAELVLNAGVTPPSPTPTPTATSTGTPAPTASASATPAPVTSTGGNDVRPNGNLADTGSSSVLPLAGGAAAVIAAGAALVVAFRRRAAGRA
ncbi:LAETG motif-containing sortase-dependent surface protein [Streptomyces sp. NPDC012888]|uniref:LAETG motif-containing sortase-dependent surface protein n=1 Tax=Streptomyces sp. NPDC012888 TaxID=3364855 RepID=UPI0036BFFD1E